jgi:formylmethanofuran dehydrogenase subunit E
MKTMKDLLEEAAALHRHLCPRIVLGVRIGILAGRVLDLDLPQSDKRLMTFVETDGCASDGISVATGCWLGRRTMRLVDFGKVAATLVDTRTSDSVRIHPHPAVRERAYNYVPDARNRWHAQLEAYQIMPDDELLMAEFVELNMSLEAIISRPGVRVNCKACGEEIINEREIIHEGTVLCRGCNGEAYYARLEAPTMEMTG